MDIELRKLVECEGSVKIGLDVVGFAANVICHPASEIVWGENSWDQPVILIIQ